MKKIVLMLALALTSQFALASGGITGAGGYLCQVEFVTVDSSTPKFVNNRIKPLYEGIKKLKVEDVSYFDSELNQVVPRFSVNILSGEVGVMSDGVVIKQKKGLTFVRFVKSYATIVVQLTSCVKR